MVEDSELSAAMEEAVRGEAGQAEAKQAEAPEAKQQDRKERRKEKQDERQKKQKERALHNQHISFEILAKAEEITPDWVPAVGSLLRMSRERMKLISVLLFHRDIEKEEELDSYEAVMKVAANSFMKDIFATTESCLDMCMLFFLFKGGVAKTGLAEGLEGAAAGEEASMIEKVMQALAKGDGAWAEQLVDMTPESLRKLQGVLEAQAPTLNEHLSPLLSEFAVLGDIIAGNPMLRKAAVKSLKNNESVQDFTQMMEKPDQSAVVERLLKKKDNFLQNLREMTPKPGREQQTAPPLSQPV